MSDSRGDSQAAIANNPTELDNEAEQTTSTDATEDSKSLEKDAVTLAQFNSVELVDFSEISFKEVGLLVC